MNNDTKLGTYGSVCLLVTLTVTKAVISAPSLYASHSLGAGWLEVLISGVFEAFVLAIVLKLMFNFEGMDILDIALLSFGKVGIIIVGLFSAFVVAISTAAVFRSFGELIRNTIMHYVSYESTAIFLLAVGIVGAYLGLRTQLNLNGLIIPILAITIAVIIFIGYSRYSVSNILPIAGSGVSSVVSNALLKNSSYFELGIILFVIPYLRDKSCVKKISFTALFVSVIFFTVITLAYQLSVPFEAAENFTFPVYQMTRMISARSFFQRIEPLNIFIWSGAMFVYIGVGIWLCARIFQKTFSLKDHRPLIYVLAEIICLIALIPGSETSVERIYDFLITYDYIAYPLIPLVFLITAIIFSPKKRGTLR